MYKLNEDGVTLLSDQRQIPADPANSDWQRYQIWLSKGNTPEPADLPSRDVLINGITAAIQKELDAQARNKGYDNIVSACSYAALPAGAPFQAEGTAFLTWRSDVWQSATTALAAIAEDAPLPTPEAAVAAMPELVLP